MKYVRITITTVLVVAIVALTIFFIMPMLQQDTATPQTTTVSVIEAADLVVAASDSPHKERADYACDCISDDIEIQAAIDALPSGGGVVALLEGTYIIDGVPAVSPEHRSIIILRDNVSVVGSGFTTILKLANGYTTDVGGIIGNSEYPTTFYDNVRIANLKVYGNLGGTYGEQGGIYLHNADDSIVENCTVISCSGHAIRLFDQCRRCIVRNNIVSGCTQGILIHMGSDCVVAENTLETRGDNIVLDKAQRCTIEGNVCIGGRNGIMLFWSSSNNTIVGNTIERPSGSGIEIRARLYSNKFGDGAKNNIISENSIYSSRQDGIRIVNTPSAVPCANDYNIITNNTIRISRGHGISLVSDHNLIENNSVFESSQEGNNKYDGIFLYDGASYNEILGNVCGKGAGKNKPRYGINISDASCVENVVRDNDLRDSGDTGNFNDAGTNTKV